MGTHLKKFVVLSNVLARSRDNLQTFVTKPAGLRLVQAAMCTTIGPSQFLEQTPEMPVPIALPWLSDTDPQSHGYSLCFELFGVRNFRMLKRIKSLDCKPESVTEFQCAGSEQTRRKLCCQS